MTDRYHTYGTYIGTCCFYEGKDNDSYLAWFEKWLPAHGVEAFMDGFMEGVMGDHRRKHGVARAFMKGEG